jgi:hypothetical protein
MATLKREKIHKSRSFTIHLDDKGKIIDIDPPAGKEIKKNWESLEKVKPKVLSMETLEIYQVAGSTLTCVHSACKLK